MRRTRPIYPMALLSILVLAAGAWALATSAAGTSGGPIYMLCHQRGEGTKPEQHPRNCVTLTTLVTEAWAGAILFDFEKLRWRDWGSDKAKATGLLIERKAHTRIRVRFDASGTQTCEGKTFYSKLLIERPHRLDPHRLTVSLPPLSCPARRLHRPRSP